MRGLFTKILHEVWLPTLLFGIGMFVCMMLLTFVLPQIYEALGDVLDRLPLARTFLTVLLGNALGEEISARTMQAYLFVHPVVLALIWAHELTLCTRTPAGEIDRGTIDLLLSLPVSRRAVYGCESIAWLVTGAVVLLMGLLGHYIAAPRLPAELRPDLRLVILVMTNLYCVYIAVGGIAFLVSALSDRRGRAIAMLFGILLASFLLNFIATFWQPMRHISFFSVLEFYQPAEVLQNGSFPMRDVVVLLAVGILTWITGGEILARRSITTV
jgi:ABC-2 type transport system permease protein